MDHPLSRELHRILIDPTELYSQLAIIPPYMLSAQGAGHMHHSGPSRRGIADTTLFSRLNGRPWYRLVRARAMNLASNTLYQTPSIVPPASSNRQRYRPRHKINDPYIHKYDSHHVHSRFGPPSITPPTKKIDFSISVRKWQRGRRWMALMPSRDLRTHEYLPFISHLVLRLQIYLRWQFMSPMEYSYPQSSSRCTRTHQISASRLIYRNDS
jgi:hypothetical protein